MSADGDDDLPPPRDDEALALRTTVSRERGRWVVDLDVVMADGAVRHRVGEFSHRHQAETCARWVARSADRYGRLRARS